MDQIKDQIKSAVHGFIDFEGQSSAEILIRAVVVSTGVAFAAGQVLPDTAKDQVKSAAHGFIDFEGQSLAETLTTAILVCTGVAAFVAGWVLADLKYTVYVGLSGTVVAFLAVVPQWPVYRRNPLSWVAVATMPEGEGKGKTMPEEEEGEGQKVKKEM